MGFPSTQKRTLIEKTLAELQSILKRLDDADLAPTATIHIQWASDLLLAQVRQEAETRDPPVGLTGGIGIELPIRKSFS